MAASKITGRSGPDPNTLRGRQEVFCRAFVESGDRKVAMERAGYTVTESSWRQNSTRLLSKPKIRARVQELMAEAADKTTTRCAVNREWVLSKLKDNIEKAEAAGEFGDVNRGLELYGKSMAMWSDKLISENLDAELANKTPAEIEVLGRALVLELGEQTVLRWLAENKPKVESVESGTSEDAAGVAPEEAGAVSAVPEAGGVSPGRVLQ